MRHPIRSQFKFRGADCLNCGAPLDLVDKYCHQCSQLNTTKRLALKDFFLEFFAGVFSYDSRTWRTVKHLLFKPGRVTKEYVQGRRLRYANPFRFFLSVCIIFFLLLQVLSALRSYGIYDAENSYDTSSYYTKENDRNSFINIDVKGKNTDSLKNQTAITILDADTMKEVEKLEKGNAVEQKIALEMRKKLEEQKELLRDTTSVKITDITTYNSQQELDDMNVVVRLFKQIDSYSDYMEKNDTESYQKAMAGLKYRDDRLGNIAFQRARAISRIDDNPAVLVEAILPKLPVFLFLFTPIVALAFWLVYIRHNINYMEHLVFVFNLQGFVFLCLIILTLLEELSWGYLEFITGFFFLVIGPFYLYKAMRKFYQQRRIKTILKFLFVNFAYFILFALTSAVVVFVGLATI